MPVSDLVTVGFCEMWPDENGHLLAMSLYAFDQVSKGLVVGLREAVRNKRWFDEIRIDFDDVRSAVKLSAQRPAGFSVCASKVWISVTPPTSSVTRSRSPATPVETIREPLGSTAVTSVLAALPSLRKRR